MSKDTVLWHHEQKGEKQDPVSFCESLALSLRSFAALLEGFYQGDLGIDGKVVLDPHAFILLSNVAEAMSLEANEAAKWFMQERRPSLSPVN